MSKTKKQIAFDIDTKVAKQILGTNYTKIYDDIKRFSKKQFDHIQGSVYVSKKAMSMPSITIFVDDLVKEYPYIEKCVRDMTVTSVSKNTSLNYHFSYDGTAGQYKKFEVKPKKFDMDNLHAREVTKDELTKLIDSKIPFLANETKDKIYVAYDKSLKAKIDEILKPPQQEIMQSPPMRR